MQKKNIFYFYFQSGNYGSPLYLKKIINKKTRFVLIGFSFNDQNHVSSSSNLNQRYANNIF
jgi:hypothetical protein